MASNFACEAVQRSGGANPTYLYAPAPSGNVENVNDNDLKIFKDVTIANAALTDISFCVTSAPNGIYSISATCTTNTAYSVSALLDYSIIDGDYVCLGTGQTTVVTGVSPQVITQVTISSGPSGPLILQNSGGPLVYDFVVNRIASTLAK